MMVDFLRKHNAAKSLDFPLITFGASDFVTGASFASGDVKISQDGGALSNTTNLPVEISLGVYALALTAGEMSAARIFVTIIDQTGPKVWIDQSLQITTFGNASAEFGFDLSIGAIPELVAGVPTATPTLQEAAMLSYMALRNKYISTLTIVEIKNDAGATIAKATVSDNGAIYTREELVSGP